MLSFKTSILYILGMTDITEKQIIRIEKELIEKVIVVSGLVFFMLLVVAQLAWPYDRDQGIISVVADKILAGGAPYKDGWDVKGPLPYYIYAFVQWISDHQDWGIRVFDFLILSYGMASVWYISQKLTSKFLASVVSFILGAWYYSHPYLGGQPDAWIGVFMSIMIAMLFYDDRKFRNRVAIFSGVLLAFIFLTKPPYLIYSFLPFIYAVLNGRGKARKATIFVVKAAITSILLIAAALFWLWINDALQEFFEIVFVYTWETHRNYFDGIPGIYFYDLTLKYFVTKEVLIPFILSFMGFVYLWQTNRNKAKLILSWFVVSCVLIRIQGTYFHYQLFLILPVIAIFTANSFQLINKSLGRATLYWLCIISLFLAYHGRVKNYVVPSFMLYAGKISSVGYYSQFQVITTARSNFYLMMAAEYLKKNNKKNRPIYILGFDPVLHYWSKTAPPTRLSFIMPFAKTEGKRFKEYSKELVSDLNNNKPEYIIMFDNDITIVQPKTSRMYSYEIDGFRKLLDSNYYSESFVNDMTFYKYHEDGVCYIDFPRSSSNNPVLDYWNVNKFFSLIANKNQN